MRMHLESASSDLNEAIALVTQVVALICPAPNTGVR
jgi:hypothetical protein